MQIRVTMEVPKNFLNVQEIRDALDNAQRHKTGPEVKALFKQTTAGFRSKPTWNQTFVHNWSKVSVTVQTGKSKSADIYALVNAGSPPHDIPLQPGHLRFRYGYTPATRPRYLFSHPYQRFGPYSFRTQVPHPGFDAREFDLTIKEEYEDTFRDDMQDAIYSAANP